MIAVLLALVCGVELWPQKILSDPGAAAALARSVRPATIAQLGGLSRRAARRTYAITGEILDWKIEADGDIHVVLTENGIFGPTIIIEFPHPECAYGSRVRPQIARARRQIEALLHIPLPKRVRVTGMLFFDRCHGQAGAAWNCVELHPVLDVRVAR